MNQEPIAVQFAKWDVKPLETLQRSKAYLLREKLNRGEKMNREEKNWLTDNLLRNTYFRTAVPLMGYRFDFSDVVKKYLVKQYGQWNEYFAADKTSLRANLYGSITEILEIN